MNERHFDEVWRLVGAAKYPRARGARVFVDVLLRGRGVRALRAAGCVVQAAEPAEPDGRWLFRAQRFAAELVVTPDKRAATRAAIERGFDVVLIDPGVRWPDVVRRTLAALHAR